ncbi:MAG: HAD-IIA family hydrolase [Hyphomicrobiaceae bacterium]
MTEPIRIALVADIHHGEDKLTKRGSSALSLLDDFLHFASDWGADIVVDLGDRISDLDRETDRSLLADVADRFKHLNTPRAHLAGNHDSAFLTPEDNADALGLSTAHQSRDIKGWHLVFWQADTFIPYPDPFRIRPSDLEWLEQDLAATRLPTIMFSHVPLGNGSMTSNYWFANNPEHAAYPNAQAARDIIEASGKVVACIAGHVHWNSLNRVNAIPHITVQSLTESFTTNGKAAGAWATLEIGDKIHWQTYGRDPIEMIVPVTPPENRWPPPLRPFRHARRALQQSADLGRIKGLLLDCDGVLYRGDQPIPGAREFLQWARTEGIPFAAITNNARRTADGYAAKLKAMGFDFPANRIVTSGHAAARHLARRSPGATVFVAGPEALKEELVAAGMKLDGTPDFVVAGIDEHLPMETLIAAARHIARGAQLVVTNPDHTHPTPDGPMAEAGAVQAFLESAGGVKACVAGKPNPAIFTLGLERIGLTAGEVMMIGDNLETDITGANAAGLTSTLVETGLPIPTLDAVKPGLLVADLHELMTLMQAARR